MKYNFPYLFVHLGPFVLIALLALYFLLKPKRRPPADGTGRQDDTERSELTGREQSKRRTE